MASNDPTPEYDFVEQPSNDYFCPITFEMLTDPQQTSSCCGNHLSRAAADRLKQEGEPCPMCNHWPLKTTDDPFFKRQVMALKVRCHNKALGCQWVGELSELEEHLNVGSVEGKCQYVDVACPYDCGDQIPRHGLVYHISYECLNRPFTCQYCSHEGTYVEVSRDHWPQCQKYPVNCPNKCCTEDIERRFLKRHLDQDCPLQEIECEFSYAGCGAKIQRRGMQRHMDKGKDTHLSILTAHVKTIKEDFQTQLYALSIAMVQTVPRPICVLPPEFEFSSFEQYKKDSDRWYSPSFYTHIGGYKMCLVIGANGWRGGKGTHVSVGLHTMKGEYDDHLQWPFKGVVKVQLINQREGGEHTEEEIVGENSKSEGSLCRVLEGQRSKLWCFSKFISHSDLYEPEEGKEYLKNDTLIFKVSSVTVKST